MRRVRGEKRRAHAHTYKDSLGLEAGGALARVRTILLGFERVWSHLNDIAAASPRVSASLRATAASPR